MKSKRLLLLLLMAFFAPWAAQAQSPLTIGTGTDYAGHVSPYGQGSAMGDPYNYYSTTQFIYTAEELTSMGHPVQINSMAFFHNANTFGATVRIYLAHTTAATVDASTPATTGTLVYTGTDITLGSSSEEWQTFVFDNPFIYNGEDNLLVIVSRSKRSSGTPSYSSSQKWQYTETTNNMFMQRSSDSQGYENITNTTYSYTASNKRPNIQIAYQAPATCPKPTGFAVSDVTHNEATLSWTENGTATSWQYCLNGDEENPVTISANPYTLTGLTPLTAYTVKVRSVGNNEYSDWSSELSFSTTAVAEVVGDGWSDDFEGATCGWDLVNGTLTNQWAWGTAANNGGTHGLYISDDGGTSNAYSHSAAIVYATKLLNFTEGKYEFSYDWKANGESSYDYLRVALVPATVTLTAGTIPSGFSTTSLPSGWIALDGGSKLNLVTAWQSKSLAINVTAGNYYLVMAWRNDGGGGSQPPAAVDNVNISKIACDYDVEGLAVSNITTTTADITWTNSEAGAWQVAVKEGADEWEIFPTIFTTNGGTLTGLTAATNYQVKVRAYCDADHQGSWCETISFASACEVIPALGFTENFDSFSVASAYTPSSRTLPTCWSYINECTYSSYMYYPTIYNYSGIPNSTPNCLRFYSYYSSYTNYDPQPQYAILPEMDGLAGMQVTLMAKGYNATSTFKIGTMSDPTDASTFTMIAEQTLTTSYPEEPFEYIIPANCTDSYLAIMIDAANSSRTSNGVYIDDIVITTPPTCIKPTSLTVTAGSITNDGATITWTPNGSETQWQIEFATDADFTHPLYETVEGEPTYTFHGLDETTTYYVHVQAVCGGNDGSSEYSATVNFTTLQTAVDVPYATDFESENGWLLVNGNLTNAWAYGEATSNGQGTHALYISNDGGTTNAYTNTSAVMVYATKLFNFEAGTYVFSYDWKANGESTYDYLRVALVPSTVTLTAGTSAPTVPSGSFYNNLPTGWIALDGGGKLNLSSDWQSYASNEIEIAAGTYMMVFAWRDDTSGGSNPPAAIDNVSIVKITCFTPTNLAVPAAGITATSVQVSWTETGEATAWQIELTENNNGSSTIDVAETDLVDGVYTIASLTPETMYSVKVRANCGDGFSRWSEEVIFETAEECQMADGLAAVATSNSAEISWNGYGQDYFNLRYGTDGETWTTESKVANPYTLNQLEPATTYYVQVQPTCAGEEYWSATLTFNTKCESITTFPWNEGFEDGELSFCWDQDQIVGTSEWSVGTGDGNTYSPVGAHTGSYNAKITYISRGNVTKLITPVLDLTSLAHPQLSFWFINRNWGSDIDGFAVYYRTASDAAWTLIDATTEAHTTWTAAGYILPNPSATYQIAFEMTDNYGYGVGLDDIVVSEAITKTITGVGEDNWDGENGGYYLFASPVVNELNPVAIGMTEGDYDLYSFDEAQNMEEWRNYKDATFKLVNGKGYLYANKNDVTLVIPGEPFGSDVQEKTYTLDYTEGTQFAGWNLVGNPFTQNAYLNKDFYVLNDTRNEVIAAADVEQYTIAPMEGAFVCAEGTEESVTISLNARNSNSGSLALNLSQGRGVVDRAVVKFGQGSMPKFQLNPNHTKVYIPQDGKDYAVVSAEAMGEMPVNFKAEKNGTYSLSFTSQEVSFSYLHLIDNMTGADVNLLETPSYTFNANTTDYAQRFRLVFATGSSIEGENFGFVNAAGNLCIFGIEGEATVQVVDVMGHVLSSETFSGSYEKSINAAPGVYMIRLINGNDVKVQKIVVR